jgi:hypothetical protein
MRRKGLARRTPGALIRGLARQLRRLARASSKRGFTSDRAPARDREQTVARVVSVLWMWGPTTICRARSMSLAAAPDMLPKTTATVRSSATARRSAAEMRHWARRADRTDAEDPGQRVDRRGAIGRQAGAARVHAPGPAFHHPVLGDATNAVPYPFICPQRHAGQEFTDERGALCLGTARANTVTTNPPPATSRSFNRADQMCVSLRFGPIAHAARKAEGLVLRKRGGSSSLPGRTPA